jgi:flagellar basal-body rod protein FlgB
MLDGIREPDLLMRLLRAAELRQKVIAGNIGNQNTPGYTRKVLAFEDELASALRTPGRDTAGIEPRIVDDLETPAKADGNNVVPELEAGAQKRNALLYETYISVLQSHYQMLQTSIESGR